MTRCEHRDHDFKQKYDSLPFGSTINIPVIEKDVEDVRVQFSPNLALQNRMLSLSELRSMWNRDETDMPLAVKYTELHYINQLAANISLVSLPGRDGEPEIRMVFKSVTANPHILYHELKVLLTLPPSPNVMAAPRCVVTTEMPSTDDPCVCGFLLRYYELGDLERGLTKMRLQDKLTFSQQLQWAKDVTAALIHIHKSGFFYSDLRMDNVLLWQKDDGSHTALLTDFQQSRNIYNWAPPEMYYVEWLADLGYPDVMTRFARETIPTQEQSDCHTILQEYLDARGYPSLQEVPSKYNNPPQGWYFPWLSSTNSEQESAMVYLLGKALWCIFEGYGDADIVLGRSNPHEEEMRFPEFKNTPEPLRELIQSCTAGAREWLDGPIKIYRKRGQVFPLGKSGKEDEPLATAEETKETIKSFWKEEIEKAKAFVGARTRYDKGAASSEEKQMLHFLRRPRLSDVLQTLDDYENPGC